MRFFFCPNHIHRQLHKKFMRLKKKEKKKEKGHIDLIHV